MPTYRDVHLVRLKGNINTDDYRDAIKDAVGDREIIQIVQTTAWSRLLVVTKPAAD